MQRSRGRVLVERRPSPGIWGGLWCFPGGKARATDRPLEPIEHGFTHFRLLIRPVMRDVVRARAKKHERWMTLAELERAAVPAPVRTLLARLSAAAR